MEEVEADTMGLIVGLLEEVSDTLSAIHLKSTYITHDGIRKYALTPK